MAPNRVTWSDELYRLFGLAPRSLKVTFESFLQRVHPDDRGRLQQAVETATNDRGALCA